MHTGQSILYHPKAGECPKINGADPVAVPATIYEYSIGPTQHIIYYYKNKWHEILECLYSTEPKKGHFTTGETNAKN